MKKLVLFTALLLSGTTFAQGFQDYSGGLKVTLDERGDKYFRLITWHQVWARYNQNNDGSTRAGLEQEATTDFGLRRSRFLMFSQINKKFLIVTHFGINNQNAVSGGLPGANGKKPQLFMHDAWVEYTVLPKYLNVGGGLHYWNGLSRMTNASTLNLMSYDAPILNWATIEATDQFARKLGIYAKGKLGKLAYQIAVNDPFETGGAPQVDVSGYNPQNDGKVFEGYFQYEFWDAEGNLLPYRVGTYLGTKKVFNIGAGFINNNNAMWHIEGNGDTLKTAMNLFAADVFLDLPLKNGGALTAYAAAYFNDFGPNNVRNIGILNPADGSSINTGLRGNAFPTLGTGTSIYTQIGYMIPKKRDDLIFQPYAALIYNDFEGVQDSKGTKLAVSVFDLGLNMYIAGHHSKLTLNYRSRPDFTNPDDVSRKSEITLQAMVYL
ncbi:MAG: hypothetical protein ACPGVV_04510 [Croceimicrobium sp.]